MRWCQDRESLRLDARPQGRNARKLQSSQTSATFGQPSNSFERDLLWLFHPVRVAGEFGSFAHKTFRTTPRGRFTHLPVDDLGDPL
jgi:hypothetical protein